MSLFHQANNVFSNGLTVTNGITTDSLTVNGVSITSGGGGGGGSTPLSTKVPTTIQQTGAEVTGTGLAGYYDNDTSKAAATNVTYSIMSEVDAINGEVVTLEATATTLQGQVAELDNVVGVLTGLSLGSGLLSTGTAALTAISAATSANAALQKSALLPYPANGLTGITSTKTTTTYDANTINNIASVVTTLNNSVTNLGTQQGTLSTRFTNLLTDNATFTVTITQVTKSNNLPIQLTLSSVTSIVAGTQITLPTPLSAPFANFMSPYVYVVSISSLTVTISYSPSLLPIISTTVTGSTVNGTWSVTCTNVYNNSSSVNAPTANALTTIQNYVLNAVASPYIGNTATSIGALSTSAVSVGNSTQTLNLNGSTVNINGTAYSGGGGSVSAATTTSAGTVQLASAIDNGANANYVPTAGQIANYVSPNAVATTPPGYDIIVVIGQSNSVGTNNTGGGNANADPYNEASTGFVDTSDPRIQIMAFNPNFGVDTYPQVAVEPTNKYSPDTYSSGIGAGQTLPYGPPSQPGNAGYYGYSTINFAMTFCKEYLTRLAPNRQILILHGGYGGTGFSSSTTTSFATISAGFANSQTISIPGASATTLTYITWNPTATQSLYTSIQGRIQYALNTKFNTSADVNKVVAILWHQGETDSGQGIGATTNQLVYNGSTITLGNNVTSSQAYYYYLNNLVSGIRATIGDPNVPFITGGMVPTWSGYNNAAFITNVLSGFANPASPYFCSGGYTGFADSTTPFNATANSSGIHFNNAGQRAMGKRYFQAYIQAKNNPSGTPSITGTLIATLGSYNVATNTYTITLTGFTAAYIATYYVYYGTTSTPTTSATLISTSSTSITVTVPPNASNYFKLAVSGISTTLTTSSALAVSQAPTPTITGFTYSSATPTTVTLSATSVNNANTTDTVSFSGAYSGTCTVAQLIAGFTASGTFSTSTANVIYANVANALSGVSSTGASYSVSFTATTNPTIASLTATTPTSTTTGVNWTINGTITSQTLTLNGVSQSVTTSTRTLSTTTTSQTAAVWVLTLQPGGASQTLTTYTSPTVVITGTPTITGATGALNIAYTISSTAASQSVSWSIANSSTPSTVITSGTSTPTSGSGTITNTVSGLTSGQSYIVTLSYTANSITATASTSAISYTGTFAVTTAGLVSNYDFTSTSTQATATSTTVNDLQGTNNLTWNSAPSAFDMTGIGGAKVGITMNGNYASKTNVSYNLSTGFTAEVLFKLTSLPSNYYSIFGLVSGSTGVTNSPTNDFAFNLTPSAYQYNPYVQGGSTSSPISWFNSSGTNAGSANASYTLAINTFYHLVVSVTSAGVATYYFNGGGNTWAGASGNWTGWSVPTGAQTGVMGIGFVPSGTSLVGTTAQVRYYNAALTTAQVQNNYNYIKSLGIFQGIN